MVSYREELGDFNSVVCTKAIITGVEDTLGEDGAAVVFIRAGKVRGHSLANELGLEGSNLSGTELATKLDEALGKNGTCLCKVLSVEEDGDTITVQVIESVCAAGEAEGSDRKATYTLGAVAGAIEAIKGKRYNGQHTASVLKGEDADTFVFTPLM